MPTRQRRTWLLLEIKDKCMERNQWVVTVERERALIVACKDT